MIHSQATSKQLSSLRERLFSYETRLLKELPVELRDEINQYEDIIGPFTTSGIEHVTAIIDRLMWAVYYFENPDSLSKPPTLEKNPAEKPKITQSSQLDFGPFDPANQRKG